MTIIIRLLAKNRVKQELAIKVVQLPIKLGGYLVFKLESNYKQQNHLNDAHTHDGAQKHGRRHCSGDQI